LRGRNRQKEDARLAYEADKPVMPVKAGGPLIFGIHKQRIGSRSGGEYAMQGITEKGTAKPVPLETRVDGKTANPHSRNARIAGQFLDKFGREIGEDYPGGGKCIKSRNCACFDFHRDKARGHAPSRILGHLGLEITIKRLLTTSKAASIMAAFEGLKAKGGRHRDVHR
jgi:hypothetical protein